MPIFRKRPIEIEAVTFDEFVEYGRKANPESADEHGGFAWSFDYQSHAVTHESDDCYLVPAHGGPVRFSRGDMLITGVDGEIYPCPGQVFAETYEPASPLAGDHIDRMHAELEQLQHRGAALDRFIQHNAMFMTLSGLDQDLMRAQLAAMLTYESLLVMRYNRAVEAQEPAAPAPEPFAGDDYRVPPAELADDCA